VSDERGQAAIELVVFAAVAAAAALCLHGLLMLSAARDRAQRIADQAAVVVAEGGRPPRALRREAEIHVDGRALVVTVPVALAPGIAPAHAVARAVLP
jgi:hypothetical protein